MITTVQKWGNSQGLRVSRDVLEKSHIAVGDVVDVRVQKNGILIQPVRHVRRKYSLRELVRQIPRGYKPSRGAWGGPVGGEVW